MAMHEDATPLGGYEASDRHLRKRMGFTHLLFLSVGSIIGSGWLFGSLKAASLAGPAAIVSWAVGGIFVIFIALNFMEQSAMMPRSGAIVRYPFLTHGAWTGWILGWTYWLTAPAISAIEAEAVVTYVASQATGSGLMRVQQGQEVLQWPNGILFFLALMVLFFLLNFFGVRLLSEANRWVTWWKIIIPSLTAIFLFTVVHAANYTSLSFGGTRGFSPNGTSAIFGALSTTGVVFAYLGFRQALEFGSEARNPQRHLPLATILSVLITIVIYVSLQIAFIGAVRWGAAGVKVGDWASLATSPWASGPLVDALRAAGIGWLATYAWFLLVDAGISPAGTGWLFMGNSARNSYGLSVHGAAPPALQRPNRWGIPWVSLVVALIVGCVFVIPAPSWYLLVGLITSTQVLTYVIGGTGLPVLRKYAPNMHRPFRLPWMWVWAPVGFLASWLLVFWAGYLTLTWVYGTVFVGLPLFTWWYAWKRGWYSSGGKQALAIAMSLVYLAAWIYIQIMGGWMFRIAPPAADAWGFIVYFAAQCADVLFFCAALWLLSSREGRKHVAHGMWLVVTLLAMLPVSYYTEYGPEKTPALGFPWGTLIAVGIGLVAFAWGVLSGFNTDELQEIVAAAEAQPAPVAAGSAGPDPEPGGEAAAAT